jgi:DNA-binding transcriptional MerR regulator
MAVPEIRRLYYSMKDVCGIARLTPHMLKSWEKKFPQLRPAQNKSGKRLYKPADIQLILKIRDLLSQGTAEAEIFRLLEGEAPASSAESVKSPDRFPSGMDSGLVLEIKRELVELLNILKE